MSDLVEIAAFESIGNATYAQALLDEQGVFNALRNYNGLQLLRPFDRVGGCLKIMVNEADSAKAIGILLDHELIRSEDLGPVKLTHILNENFSQNIVGTTIMEGEKIWKTFLIILVILITLLLIFGSGGGKF